MSNINLTLCNLNPITPLPIPQWNQQTILIRLPYTPTEKVSGQFRAWPLPAEVAPLSTVTQAQGKTERKDLLAQCTDRNETLRKHTGL